MQAQIAQLVEQRTENPRVTGSIPVLGTEYRAERGKRFADYAGVVQWLVRQPSKLDTWVRFPSPALLFCPFFGLPWLLVVLDLASKIFQDL